MVALSWLVLWIWIALTVRGVILDLRGPSQRPVDAGTSLQSTFTGAADSAADIPLVGDALADALGGGTATGDALVEAGTARIDRVGALAFWALVVLILLPLRLLLVTPGSRCGSVTPARPGPWPSSCGGGRMAISSPCAP